MTRAFIGGMMCFDEMAWAPSGGSIDSPVTQVNSTFSMNIGASSKGTAIDEDLGGADAAQIEDSRMGLSNVYPSGPWHMAVPNGTLFTQNYRSISFKASPNDSINSSESGATDGVDEFVGFQSSGGTRGVQLRIVHKAEDAAGKFYLRLARDGDAFDIWFNESNQLDDGDYDSSTIWTLQVDLEGTQQARLLVNGGDTLSLGWTNISVDVSSKTDCCDGMGGPVVAAPDKGTNTMKWNFSWICMYDDSTATTGVGSTFSVHSIYATGDSTPMNFSAVGNEANCSSDVFRAIDDVEDEANQTLDYAVSDAVDGAADQALFNVGNVEENAVGSINSTNGTVLGVAITTITPPQGTNSQDTITVKMLSKHNATTETVTGIEDLTAGGTHYAWFQDSGDGADWGSGTNPEDVFNDSLFGFEVVNGGDTGTTTNSSSGSLTDTTKSWTTDEWVGYFVIRGSKFAVITSNTSTKLNGTFIPAGNPGAGTYTIEARVFGMVVHICGDNLVRPTQQTACPAASTRRIFIT